MGWRELNDALNSYSPGLQKLRDAVSPWQYLSATDIASNLPGGGIVNAWQDSGKGWQNLKAGNYGQAAINYGNMAVNLVPEGAGLAKLAAAFVPALRAMPDALPLQGGSTTVYHGTGRTYDEPKLGAPETTFGQNNLEAHYVTARPETANAYSTATGNFRQNTEGWAPQTRIYSMGDANTLALTPEEFWMAKRVGTGQDPSTFGKHAAGEHEQYLKFLTDAFGEAPKPGEAFTEFLQRKGVQRVTSGGAKPDEIMVMDPSILAPKYGNVALPNLAAEGDNLARSGMSVAPSIRDIGSLRSHLDNTFPGVDHWVSENPNAVTVSKVVVPPEARGQGTGTAFMNDVIEYADRVGKPVALTPDASFGGKKSKLEEWYRSLGFEPNKGRSRDYSISESMVRKPVKDD